MAKRSFLVKGKKLKGRKRKEGYLFSLDGIKKVERNLGAKDSFEKAGNIGKIR